MSEYLRDHREITRNTKDIHILVAGPEDFDDEDFVYDELDRFLAKYDKVIIHDNCKPKMEYQRSPENWSCFPLAARWTFKRFQSVVRHHSDYVGKVKKKQKKGLHRQMVDQLKNSDRLIVFRDFEDERTERIIKMAKELRVPISERRV